MRETISAVISFGAGRPGTAAVVMTTVGRGDAIGQQLALAALVLLRELLGVLARAPALRLLLDLDLDELGAEALDLFLDRRPHVVGLDHRAEALRGRNRLQARDSRAEDEHARRLRGAGRGDQHREELAQLLGARERGAIAAHDRLRGQRVHRLRARGAGDHLHRETT